MSNDLDDVDGLDEGDEAQDEGHEPSARRRRAIGRVVADPLDRRGRAWDYDPGPPKNRRWARLFAQTPDYRRVSLAQLGEERFRWHFGPMFYRGRLRDKRVKVLIIGQEGAQDESLARRAFTGGTGARMQYFLHHLGIDYSYLFLNTFVYPIFGQYDDELRPLAQSLESPIVRHRHEVFDYVLARNDVRLVVAVGRAAQETVVTWVESHGGRCPDGVRDLSTCEAHVLSHRTRAVGVPHPGGAANGGAISAIVRGFKKAFEQIESWAEDEPDWLPVDKGMQRQAASDYRYRSAPIPLRDFAFGNCWRLGRGGTSSNRKDRQRSIQLFSAGGKYNAEGESLAYRFTATGSREGYAAPPGDRPYEPPRDDYRDFDNGPGPTLARLFMAARREQGWPDFAALGLRAHPSLGYGPIYRGRARGATLLLIADQQSHDDLFTTRALTGDCGQHLQPWLAAIGLPTRYLILRSLPVDTLFESEAAIGAAIDHPSTIATYQAIIDYLFNRRQTPPQLIITMGPWAARLSAHLRLPQPITTTLARWRDRGSLADWQDKLELVRTLDYSREVEQPSFEYAGERGQIPRSHLPYGMPRWLGSSGSRASQPTDLARGDWSFDYYKLYLPNWVHRLEPGEE